MVAVMIAFLGLLLLYPLALADSPAAPIPPQLDATILDRSVDPCTDFYHYSCGTWLKSFQLPPDRSAYWRQGDWLSDRIEVQLNGLLPGSPPGEAVASARPMRTGFPHSIGAAWTRRGPGSAPSGS